MKTCNKCGETKSLDDFSKDSSRKDGKQTQCKVCYNAWRAANIARVREKDANYRKNNKARILTVEAAYRDKNRAKLRQYAVEYKKANPEKVQASRAKRRARANNAQHAPYSRADIFAAYGDTCVYCDAPAEHLDHVVPLAGGGADAAHNLLPACAPCNLTKSARSLADWVLSWT